MAVTFDLVCVAVNLAPTATTFGLPTNKILGVRPANAGEIAAFPTALTVVDMEGVNGQSWRSFSYLSSTATATVKTAING